MCTLRLICKHFTDVPVYLDKDFRLHSSLLIYVIRYLHVYYWLRILLLRSNCQRYYISIIRYKWLVNYKEGVTRFMETSSRVNIYCYCCTSSWESRGYKVYLWHSKYLQFTELRVTVCLKFVTSTMTLNQFKVSNTNVIDIVCFHCTINKNFDLIDLTTEIMNFRDC